jgi:hypothetical protein
MNRNLPPLSWIPPVIIGEEVVVTGVEQLTIEVKKRRIIKC